MYFLYAREDITAIYLKSEKIDNKLRDLNIYITYKNSFKLICCFCIFIPLVIIQLFFSGKSITKQILDMVSSFYPLAIRFIALCLAMFLMYFIGEKFTKLNAFLESLDEEDIFFYNAEFHRCENLKLTLEKAYEIFIDLIDVCKLFNKALNGMITMFFLTSFLQSLFLLFMLLKGFTTELSVAESVYFFTSQLAQLLVFLHFCEDVKQKVSERMNIITLVFLRHPYTSAGFSTFG